MRAGLPLAVVSAVAPAMLAAALTASTPSAAERSREAAMVAAQTVPPPVGGVPGSFPIATTGVISGDPRIVDADGAPATTPLRVAFEDADSADVQLLVSADRIRPVDGIAVVLLDARGQQIPATACLVVSGQCAATIRPSIASGVTPLTVRLCLKRAALVRPAALAAGMLVVSIGSSGAPSVTPTMLTRAVRPFVVTPLAPNTQWIVLWSLLGAIVVTVLGFSWRRVSTRGAKVAASASATSWDPGSSWATNVGLGSVLVAAIGTAFLPDQPHYVPKATYAVLSAVFGALLGLAAPVSGLAAHPVTTDGQKPHPVWAAFAILVGSVVTLWGALGALATAAALFGELRWSALLPTAAAIALQLLVLVLAVVLVLYAVRAIAAAIGDERPGPPSAAARAAAGPGAPPPRDATRWTLL